jgi:protein SCO1/2
MPANPRPPRTIWLGFSFVIVLVGLTLIVSLYQSSRVRSEKLPVLNHVADFTLTNQDDKTFTLAALTNHVWVADIIFTRCAGPCPRMTAQMKSLQDSLPPDSSAKLITLTTDPDYDSPTIMKRYGEHYGANFDRWNFLTGTKKEIAGLAADSLKLSAVSIDPANQKNVADLFIHTTIFVVVDKHAQLRGIFETGGEGVDWTNSVKPKLLATVRQLQREP